MNNICKKCNHQDKCLETYSCDLINNKTRVSELNLARTYLNSDYYWKRLKELKDEAS